ncbi:RNA polymerase subunit sigma-70, partial [Streptomyces sp. NPDC056159]
MRDEERGTREMPAEGGTPARADGAGAPGGCGSYSPNAVMLEGAVTRWVAPPGREACSELT